MQTNIHITHPLTQPQSIKLKTADPFEYGNNTANFRAAECMNVSVVCVLALLAAIENMSMLMLCT